MADKASPQRMNRQERTVIAYTGLAHALSHTPEWAYAAVLIQVGLTFGVGELVLGSIGTAYAVGYGISAVPAGWLADKTGSRRTLALSTAGSGVMCIAMAFSQNTVMFAVTMTMLGLAAGMYHPVGISFITRSVRARTKAMGYHGVAGSFGIVLAPAIGGGLAALISWRASLVAFGVMFLAVAFILAKAKLEEPQTDDTEEAVAGDKGGGVLASIKPFLLLIGLIFFINTMYGFIYRGIAVFLPTHIQANVSDTFLGSNTEAMAGTLTAAVLIFASFGQFIGGHLGERFAREKLTLVLTLVLAPTLLLTASANGVLLLAAAGLFIFFYFMAQPSYMTLLADYTPRRIQGRLFGFLILAFYVVGSASGVLTGWVVQHYSTDWAFVVLAGAGFVVTIAAGLLVLAAARRVRLQKVEAVL
ncbi:MAG: MFS family permease [Chloroflexi bacterium]|nr:MAG: MFS family permease [Chloroflexota bacterium]